MQYLLSCKITSYQEHFRAFWTNLVRNRCITLLLLLHSIAAMYYYSLLALDKQKIKSCFLLLIIKKSSR